MEKPYQLSCLFPFIDLALLTIPNPHSTLQDLYPKAIFSTTPFETIKEKLQEARIVFLHPDGISFWTDVLTKEVPFKINLFIVADSDFTTGHEHIDPLLSLFPTAQFWVQNWFGYHERVSFLPIGVNGQCSIEDQRTDPLGISFFLEYQGYIHREDFSRFIKQNHWIQDYLFPRVDYPSYCRYLSECRFSCCPMGGGYDTLRFWECLMMKTIPIVKSHVFYDALRLHYPKLPFLTVDNWEDLQDVLPTLTDEYYEELFKKSDLSPCLQDYWLQKLHDHRFAEN